MPTTPQHARAKRRGNQSGKGEKRLPKLSVLAQQERFLRQFAIIGNVTHAARLAGIDRTRHYVWLDDPAKYPDYEARFVAAKEEALDRMRQEIWRRGVQGWDEPVFGNRVDKNGKSLGTGIVGTRHVYSDRMLELGARVWLPEMKVRLEVTGKDGGPTQTEMLSKLTDEQLATRLQTLQQILRAAQLPGPPAATTFLPAAPDAEVEAQKEAYRKAPEGRNGGKNGEPGS